MKRIVCNFEHKASYADVDEAFAAYVAEAQKMIPALTAVGLSLYVDSEKYLIGYKGTNNVIVPILILSYSTYTSHNQYNNPVITLNRNGAITNYYYGRLLTNADDRYTPCITYAPNSSTTTSGTSGLYPRFFIHRGANFYSGNNSLYISGAKSRGYNSSPYNNYLIGNQPTASRFLTLIIYYTANSAFFIANTTSGDVSSVTNEYNVSMIYKGGTMTRIFYDFQNGSNYHEASHSSITSYDELHPENGTYTFTSQFWNSENNVTTEKATIQEVQIDAEGNTLGDEVYVGKIPAPNGRYYIGGNPYFFVNGLGVKDPD